MLGTLCYATGIYDTNESSRKTLMTSVKAVNATQDCYWEMRGLKRLCEWMRDLGMRFGWAWVERWHDRWIGLSLGVRRVWGWMPGGLVEFDEEFVIERRVQG